MSMNSFQGSPKVVAFALMLDAIDFFFLMVISLPFTLLYDSVGVVKVLFFQEKNGRCQKFKVSLEGIHDFFLAGKLRGTHCGEVEKLNSLISKQKVMISIRNAFCFAHDCLWSEYKERNWLYELSPRTGPEKNEFNCN